MFFLENFFFALLLFLPTWLQSHDSYNVALEFWSIKFSKKYKLNHYRIQEKHLWVKRVGTESKRKWPSRNMTLWKSRKKKRNRDYFLKICVKLLDESDSLDFRDKLSNIVCPNLGWIVGSS